MKVNVIFDDEEKKKINSVIEMLCIYKNHTTESGADFVQTLETINHLTNFLNRQTEKE